MTKEELLRLQNAHKLFETMGYKFDENGRLTFTFYGITSDNFKQESADLIRDANDILETAIKYLKTLEYIYEELLAYQMSSTFHLKHKIVEKIVLKIEQILGIQEGIGLMTYNGEENTMPEVGRAALWSRNNEENLVFRVRESSGNSALYLAQGSRFVPISPEVGDTWRYANVQVVDRNYHSLTATI